MATDKDAKRRSDVEAAIRSLYDLFPETTNYSHRGKSTNKVLGLQRAISARKAELDKDSKLANLQKQLKTEQARVNAYAREQRKAVDALLREFRLRGESEALLKKVETLARTEAVVLQEDSDDE